MNVRQLRITDSDENSSFESRVEINATPPFDSGTTLAVNNVDP